MTATQSQLQFSYEYLLRLGDVTPSQLYFGAASVADEAAAARDILGMDAVEDDEPVTSGLKQWAAMNVDEATGQVIA